MDFPDNPVVGQQFTSGSNTWEWTGKSWQGVLGLSNSITVFEQTTPPVDPTPGDIWIEG